MAFNSALLFSFTAQLVLREVTLTFEEALKVEFELKSILVLPITLDDCKILLILL